MGRFAAWTLALATGCSFDSTGQGSTPGVTAGTTGTPGGTGTGTTGVDGLTTGVASVAGTTGAVDASTTDDGTTGPLTLTGFGPTGDETTSIDEMTSIDPSTTTGTTSDETTTTGPPDDSCQGQVLKIIEFVEDAGVESPMVKEWSDIGEGRIASSPTAEEGWVQFAVDIPCTDTYAVWGRVFDGADGPLQNDPDSFYIQLDGGPEATWVYGCQTDGDEDNNWTWQRTQTLQQSCRDVANWVLPPLVVGTHTIRLRNREAAVGMDVRASVARLLITNDPNYTPTDE